MFSYYGSKSKIIKTYPTAKHKLIIEPFAGAAWYSLHHSYTHLYDVWINDIYDVVYRCWKFMQNASVSDIESLPVLGKKQDIRDLNLTEDEKLLMSFMASFSATSPKFVVTKGGAPNAVQSGMVNQFKQRFRKYHHCIKDWNITNLCYSQIPNQLATWFIDPPYEIAGKKYVHSQINYEHLAQYSKERLGQTLVCENAGAKWLPFLLHHLDLGSKRMNIEVLWENDNNVTL